MEEYSLSFLVKDRCLNEKKRKWIREHVQKRECIHFFSLKIAIEQLDSPRQLLSDYAVDLGPGASPEELEAVQRRLCRCGRQYRNHVTPPHPAPHNRSRDYRLFSANLPTDVCLQITQTELSREKPISYCPKQVIRLAADTELDVLQQLIGPIWHVPKASFLLSVYGSEEGIEDMQGLVPALEHLLRVLSNPGSVLVTVALADWEFYRTVLGACDISWPQLPFAEITPVAIVPWASLTGKEKQLLENVTEQNGGSVEMDTLGRQVRAVYIRKKGYFLLADYGVHTVHCSATQDDQDADGESSESPTTGRRVGTAAETETESPHRARMSRLSRSNTDEDPHSTIGEAGSDGTTTDGDPNAEETKTYRLFTHNFPHPLRGRVETLLRSHTHGENGQGTVMVMYGTTSFLDLAAAHGAILSGVPVIWDKSGTGATGLLRAVLHDLEKRDHRRQAARLISDSGQFVIHDEQLKRFIEHHRSELPDFERYEGQVFRVIRDIVSRPQLVTVGDLYSADSLLRAAIEALIKARAGEGAVVFLQKNTMRLAGEDDAHPVKSAQKEFQRMAVQVALQLNRPELLDVIMAQGCVTYAEVFEDVTDPDDTYITAEEATDLQAGNIPYSKIKELCRFAARGRFVERICKLKNIAGWEVEEAGSVVHCLFLYAVLNGQTQMARHFWRQPVFQDHVAHALVAAHVSRYLADKVPGDQQVTVFRQQSEEFEALARGTLNDCYLHDPKKASALVTRQAEAFELSPIEAAISFQMRSFVAHPACSDFLDSVWRGEDLPSSTGDKERPCCCKQKFVRFLTAPRAICFVSTVLYLVFLGLYGHTIIFQSGRGSLTPLDIALIAWTGVFLIEEIVQLLKPKGFLMPKGDKEAPLKAKFVLYFSDAWNCLDVLSLLIFVLGYVLRLSLPSSEAGHVVLSLVYILFFLRLLRVLTVSRYTGPMLPMIWNMLGDLVPFLVILFIFVFAYGLASEALLHAGTSWNGLYLLYLPRVAFWPIFGEYGLDSVDGGDCQNNTLWYTEGGAEVLCPSRIGRHIVPVLLGLYILITNVLMLNLLIAYFNHSFEKVHTESHTWWAWLRCGLIGEYYARPLLPAPFVILYRLVWVLRSIFRTLRACYRCLGRCCDCRKGVGGFAMNMAICRSRAPDSPVEAIRRTQLQEVFAEQAEVLDVLDLEEFRFSNLGCETDHKKAFFAEHSAVPSSDERAMARMSQLQRWEALRAVSYLMASQSQSADSLHTEPRAKISGQKEALRDDLETVLLRLEKKVEDSKQQLEAMNNALTRSSQDQEPRETDPAPENAVTPL